jgi:hypothetical protein
VKARQLANADLEEVVMIFLFPGILIVAILLTELGRWYGIHWRSRNRETSPGGGIVESAVFGLMGLLIAFTFYGAETRFETRRSLILEEVNAIDTACHRLDLLPADTQPKLREDLRKYIHSRLAIYQHLPDWEAVGAVKTELGQSIALQREIWREAVAASKQADSPEVRVLIVPAIDHMIDIATTQTVALQRHPPGAVWAMLALTLLASCVLAGYSMSASGTRSWVHIVVFSLLFSAVIYVNLDFEYPRMRGLIRIDEMDKVLLETLDNLK